MDINFFEFWGRLFTNLARGQKQIEDFRAWFSQGLSGYDSLTAMFRKVYNLDNFEDKSNDYEKLWQKSVESFQKSFRESLALMKVVPKDEYEELARKCTALEKTVSEREETIVGLRRLLSEEGLRYPVAVDELRDLMKKQHDQFQDLLKNTVVMFDQETKADRSRKKKH
jgi:glutaredoxin 2